MVLAYLLFILDNIIRESLRTKHKAKRFYDNREDKNSSLLAIAFLLVVPLMPLFTSVIGGNYKNSFIQLMGICIMLIGIIIRIIAMRTLGRFYTGTLHITEEHHIITNGIYQYIRHPGYFSVLLISFGFGLAVGNWIVIGLIIILFFLVYSYRISVEEKMLSVKFAEYKNYMKKTSGLIPFLY